MSSVWLIPLLLTLISLGFYPATPALAAQVTPVVYSTSTAEVILRSYAVKYGINGDEFVATAKCESGFNEKAVGDRGTSFGAWQIHLSAHPDITKAQALDPLWATNWAAQEFAAGHQHIWTCYRLLASRGG